MSSLKEIIATASNKFSSLFGSPPKFGGHGSGRVNLIGEHTDYNDGLVLPMALPLHTVMIGNLSDSSVCRIHTLASVGSCQDLVFQLDQLQSKDSEDEEVWAKYIKGVIDNFPNKQSLKPFNAVIATSVPLGAGLSSSAALEVATFYFLESLMPESTSELDIVEKAKICQKAEHDWVGVPCGLMDQLVSFSGQENHALLIDCRSNSIEYVPLPPEDQYVFVVVDSHVKHEHASNEYVNRRRSCEQVASLLAKSSLRDISMRELESSLTVLPEDLYRIARHVITENERTLNAADALKRNHLTVFGALMTQVSTLFLYIMMIMKRQSLWSVEGHECLILIIHLF